LTYATLLEDETVRPNYLAVLKPRRRVTGFTLFSGSVYSAPFSLGQIVSVAADGVELTEAGSTSLAADEWFMDVDAGTLYVRIQSGADPDTVFLVATYEIFAATLDAHWHRDPLNTATRTVYFDPIIKRSPQVKESMGDVLFGFAPVESTNIALINAEHWAEKHLRSSSFSGAELSLYHWLDDLDVANIKLVMRGVMGNVDYTDDTLTISVKSAQDIFSQEYRNAAGDEFFSTATFANLDPAAVAKPIRRFWGRLDGVPCTNVDYQDDSPTTSDNRDYVVCNGQDYLDDVQKTVIASPTSTTTRTYINSVTGLNVGDTILLDKATDESAEITAVGANYVDHTAITTPATTGELVKRAFVGSVSIIKDGVLYKALYGRDYTVDLFMSGGTSGFHLATTVESNLSIPSTITPSDKIFARVYGPGNNLTLGGPSFGTNSTALGNMSRPAQIILDILKRTLLVTDAQINQSSFSNALSNRTEDFGLAVPATSGGEYPKYRDLIAKILEASLLQMSLDSDQKWELTVVGPAGSADYSVQDDEILRNSYTASFSYNDVASDIVVEYDAREVSDDPAAFSEQVSQVSAFSQTASYLHGVSRTLTKRVPLVFASDAQTLADRLSYALGDYQAAYKLGAKNRLFPASVGSVVSVSRTKQPGASYDGETESAQALVVYDVQKGLDRVNLTMTDQKGIEDNSADW